MGENLVWVFVVFSILGCGCFALGFGALTVRAWRSPNRKEMLRLLWGTDWQHSAWPRQDPWCAAVVLGASFGVIGCLSALTGAMITPDRWSSTPATTMVSSVNVNSELTLLTRVGRLPVETLDSKDALAEWRKRKERFKETGRWPILVELDSVANYNRHEPNEGIGQSLAALLALAEKVDLPKVAAKMRRDYLSEDNWEMTPDERREFLSDWAAPDPAKITPNPTRDQIPYLVREGGPKIGLIEVPCKEPWQALGAIAWGGWNMVPEDSVLVAAYKRWHKDHDAVPIAFSKDVIELWLDKPVNDPKVAAELALVQSSLCPDAVDQGKETVQKLAQSLMNNPIWFFWWD